MAKNLEAMFHREMLSLHRSWRDECDYNASIFIKIVNQHGGLQAAKILLKGQSFSRGFLTLMNLQRLDLSMENLVLQAAWRPLFTDAELDMARNRLQRAGFFKTSGEKTSLSRVSLKTDSAAEDVPRCPKCGQPMVLRTSRVGNKFYGCSRYPECTGSRNYEK